MSAGSDTDSPRRDWGSLLVAFGIALLGVSIVGMAVYADVTTTVTRDDFAEYKQNCDDLENQTRMVDAGLGMEWEQLNETHVQQCKNATYAEYRDGKRRSMSTAPLNPGQWALSLGLGLSMTGIGVVVVRQELASGEYL